MELGKTVVKLDTNARSDILQRKADLATGLRHDIKADIFRSKERSSELEGDVSEMYTIQALQRLDVG